MAAGICAGHIAAMKTLAAFTKPEDAHNLRAFVAGSGISAYVRDESVIGADPLLANAIGGVRVDVGDEDFARSVALLAAVSGDTGEPEAT